MKVLIVDDSAVYRSFVKDALTEIKSVEVVGTAPNGKVALDLLPSSGAELVILDLEMPEMDGLQTLREMRRQKMLQRVIFFSGASGSGGMRTIEALSEGAEDFIAKPDGSLSDPTEIKSKILSQLRDKILQFEAPKKKLRPSSDPPRGTAYARKELSTFRPEVIVIGSSTGGPPALEKALHGLGGLGNCPILIAQHMPPEFTTSLALRLEKVTGLPCSEGKHQEELKAGRIYVAPGDYHMEIKKAGDQHQVVLHQKPHRNFVRPAVDHLFESAAKIFSKKCFALVLTGMGEDGKDGCRAVKECGGGVMIQDQESCVVFGMPGAVYQDGTFDDIGNLQNINQCLRRMLA